MNCEMRGEEFDVAFEFDVKQEMRDGTRLSSNIYRPAVSKEKFPVLVTRSPYQTVAGFQKRMSDEAKFYAKRGYVYLIQDCRGKNDSDGEYHPFFDDPTDGFDTLKWCARQEWSNSSSGTTGASYLAWNQWGTAALNPPGLKAMVSTVALPDPVLNVPFQNGALYLWMAEWLAMVDGRKNTDVSIFDSQKIYEHLPLATMDQKFGRKSKTWQNWISHPSADDYWKKSFYQDKFDRIDVPALHISGWYDDDVIGTHINFTRMREKSPSESSRKNQKLIIGPWPHHVNYTRQLGPIDFGDTAIIDLAGIKLAWFDYWLKGIDNGIMDEPRVSIFAMGQNQWKKSDDWPLPGTKYVKYYLNSAGRANTSFGDGSLSTDQSKEGSYDQYSYDPLNPCPTIFDSSFMPAEAPFDQRPIEMRNDMLVYSTPELEREVEVSGPVEVILYASTSATDTDFWAELTDVFPNGFSMHLTEGIIRGRYRKSLETPELLQPGTVYEFKIDLWVTSNLFLKGHKIRLDVSSSSFSKYDRNPNTGHEFGVDVETIVANQRVFHSSKYPSHAILPIV
jgi:putative CocE/NonD family hydrolase